MSDRGEPDENPELAEFQAHVKRQINALNYGLTRVLFGEYDVVLRAADADVDFGNLAMMVNVAINSARIANEETEKLLEAQSIDRSRFEAILESTDAGIVCFSGDGHVMFANASFEGLTGIEAADLVGQTVVEVSERLTAMRPDPVDTFTNLAENPGLALYMRCSVELPVPRTFRLTTRPVLSGPDAHGYILILRDISEVEAARRAREELLGNLAHEVRTPLTSIRGFVELLTSGAMGPVSDAQQAGLAVVERNVGRLLDLVTNMLDVDRVKAGAIDTSATAFDPVLDEVLESESPLADQKRLSIHANLEQGLVVRCGRPMLRQIVRNLVSNAIKYTPRGSVHITTRTQDAFALFECRDTGIGIRADDQRKVFERFFRSDDDAIDSIGGTGVGLSIVRRFVEAVSGRIELSSEPGRGSTFRVFLPIDRAA